MKSDGIQRAVRANRHERSAGDAPSLGRLARMRGTGLPKGRRRRRKRSERAPSSGKGKVVFYWSLLLGVFSLGLLGAAFFLWLKPQMDSAQDAEMQSLLEVEENVRVPSKFPSPSEREALDLVKQALAVRNPEKVAGKFHLGTSDSRQIVDFLSKIEIVDGMLDHYEWLSNMDANGLSIDGVLVHYLLDGKTRQRLAFLTPDDNGVWKIDFDGFARTVTPSWTELLEKGADHATVRVYLGEDSYYNGPFSDDKQWISYGFASSDTDQLLIGYCKVDSAQAKAIRWMFAKGTRINRAILEIRRVNGAEPKQFEITKVLAEDWVMGKTPFEDGFK